MNLSATVSKENERPREVRANAYIHAVGPAVEGLLLKVLHSIATWAMQSAAVLLNQSK